MAEREFRITAGQSPEDLRITIEDEISGTVLASLRLDAVEIWQMLRGGIIKLQGTGSDHMERVGKTLIRDQVLVPESALKGASYDNRVEAGENWARETMPGWTEYSGHRQRLGISVTLRKWN